MNERLGCGVAGSRDYENQLNILPANNKHVPLPAENPIVTAYILVRQILERIGGVPEQ